MLPPYVAVPDAPIFASSGYLTPAYDPFAVSGDPNQAGFRVRNLTPARPAHAGAAAPPPRDGQVARRLRPRRPADRPDDQPRPVRRAGVLAADLERGPGRVPDRRRVDRGPREVRPDDLRPVVPAGPAADRGRRLVRHGQRSRAWARSAGTRTPQNFPTIKNTLAPPLDKGVAALLEDLAERGLLDEHAGRHDGRVRPDARRSTPTPAATTTAGPTASCSPARAFPAGLVLGQTDASGDAPDRAPRHPGRPGRGALPQARASTPRHKFEAPDGRPIRLVDGAQPPSELI